MNIITILFYIFILIILAYIAIFKRNIVRQEYTGQIDVSLVNLNVFIRREFLFQLINWLNSGVNVKNMSTIDHTSVVISELKDPEILKTKMTTITSVIVGNMSKRLLAEFHSVYNNMTGEEIPTIVTYVSRQVMFYIRKVNVDISTMFNVNKDKPVDDLLKLYILGIENEIYNLNQIQTVTGGSSSETTSAEKENRND